MAKNKSFELNTREPKVKKPKPEKQPKAPKEKKPKAFKEKPVKISKEKPIKEKQPKAFKEKQPKAFKVQKEKEPKQPKVKKEKAPKQPKEKKVKTPKEKTPKVKKELSPKAAKAIKLSVILSVVVVLITALAIAGLKMYDNKKKEGEEVTGITISSTPYDLEYIVGEDIDYDGLIIIATQRNGNTFSVPLTDCTISGYDNTKATDSLTIRVEYKGYIVTFNVQVKEAPKPVTLASIEMYILPKTVYKISEGLSLDTTGGYILRKYSDGSEKTLPLINAYVTNFDKNWGRGFHTVHVKYKEGGIPKYTEYEIWVDE